MRSRTMLGATIGIVVLALLIGAALVGSGRSVEEYDPGSPEATVQRYFDALIDERPADAYDLFSERVSANCRRPYLDMYSPPVSRVVLDKVELDGTTAATVDVRITETWGSGPFSNSENTFNERLHLVSEDGRWVFAQVPWPYPCPPDFIEDPEHEDEPGSGIEEGDREGSQEGSDDQGNGEGEE